MSILLGLDYDMSGKDGMSCISTTYCNAHASLEVECPKTTRHYNHIRKIFQPARSNGRGSGKRGGMNSDHAGPYGKLKKERSCM